MKKLILFILSINLFAWPFMNNTPKWINNHSKYEFIGISTPKKTQKAAINDAIADGLNQVSNQLGVVINSDFTSSTSVNNNNISQKQQIKTNLKSFSKIENYQIKNQYCKQNDDKYICYVLIHFTKQDFIKLKKDTQKRVNKLNKLLIDFENAINNNEYKKAKNIYSQIILIPESNLSHKFFILKKKFETMIHLEISDLNTEVLPLENINFSIISNKNGFLYIIYNNGMFAKLIYHKKIIKDKPIIIDSNYQYNSNNNQKLIIIFSKYKLDIPTDDNHKILNSNNLWRIQLKNGLNNLEAIMKIFKIKVKKDIKRICIKTSNNPISIATKQIVTNFFRNTGLNTTCKNYDYLLKINISKNKVYAQEEYSYIYELTFNFTLEDNIIGEIDSIKGVESYYIAPDREIAQELKEDKKALIQDWHLESLYKTIVGNN